MSFHRGETVICSIEVRSNNTLTDPDTSMKISIWDAYNGAEVTDQAMTPDSTGKYHYDYTPSSTDHLGKYKVIYTAVHSGRTVKESASFMLEE